jgi:hypothetical protein
VPVFRMYVFSWFRMASACCLHNLVMSPYMYGMLKAMCNSLVDVRLRKLPVVRGTLFCRRCNLVRGVSAANTHAGHV